MKSNSLIKYTSRKLEIPKKGYVNLKRNRRILRVTRIIVAIEKIMNVF